MSNFTGTVDQINHQTANYMPTVIATIQAVEAASSATPEMTGAQKAEIAISAASQALSGSTNQNVAGVAQLVNLGVLVYNLFGLFKHKAGATK